MPTNTYTALLTTTVGTATPTVSISPIPSGYTDLVVVGSIRSSSSTSVMRYRYNGATTNYSATTMYGVGSGSGGSFRTTGETGIYGVGGSGIYVTNTADTFTTFNLHIFNYANTTTFKTSIVRTGGAASADATVGLWRATPAAITQLDFVLDTGNFAVGSTFTIYGIANADNFAKATGGIIREDENYWYHVFGANGTFTPKQSLSCDYIIVGGGGGGGGGVSAAGVGGGGGAGGYRAFTSQSLSATAYSVTVGGGGTTTAASNGVNGNSSTFNSATSAGGGGGASWNSGGSGQSNGSAGGSGGGAGQLYGGGDTVLGGAGNTPSTTPSQGNRGGNGNTSGAGNYSGCGGGGATANGTDVTVLGAIVAYTTGGNGSSAHSSWGLATGVGQNVNGTVYFAGGGGGAGVGNASSGAIYVQGGFGGGGAGSWKTTGSRNPGQAALAYTGGGGGGGGENVAAGNGGAGVVIIRYAK